MSSSAVLDRNVVSEPTRKKMPQWFFCHICKVIMLRAFQLICGHLVCEPCKARLEKDRVQVCGEPKCEDIALEEIANGAIDKKIYEDKCQTRTILAFKIDCIYSSFGCGWVGDIKDYIEHYLECQNRPEAEFENTEAFIQPIKPLKAEAPIHYINQLQRPNKISDSLQNCYYCKQGGFTNSSQLETHEQFDCPDAELVCPYSKVGCPEHQRQKQCDLLEHKRYGSDIHLELLLEDHLSLRRTCIEDDKMTHHLKKSWISLDENFKRISIELMSLNDKSEVRFHDVDRRLNNLERELNDGKKNSDQRSLQLFETRLSDIEAMLSCFQEDRLNPNNGAVNGNIEQRLEKLEKVVERFNTGIQKVEQLSLQHEKQLAFKNARIESLESQLGGSEVTSYDGVQYWKITDFLRKRQDAITKKRTYILSPPFFSGKRGYKMCMRLYLNGDGQGKGTHVSVFFTILKGPYDALLPWPFKQVVRLAIMDQDNNQNAEDSFRPDPTSVSFQRPKNDANISSGCPMFLQLASLNNGGFVKDDCMFLRTTVDPFSL